MLSYQMLISNLLIVQIKLFNRIIPNLNLFRPHKSTIIRSTSKITFSLYPSSPPYISNHSSILQKKRKEHSRPIILPHRLIILNTHPNTLPKLRRTHKTHSSAFMQAFFL